MGRRVHGFAHGGKAAGNAGGSFGLDDEHSLDSMVLVPAQALLDRIGGHTAPYSTCLCTSMPWEAAVRQNRSLK